MLTRILQVRILPTLISNDILIILILGPFLIFLAPFWIEVYLGLCFFVSQVILLIYIIPNVRRLQQGRQAAASKDGRTHIISIPAEPLPAGSVMTVQAIMVKSQIFYNLLIPLFLFILILVPSGFLMVWSHDRLPRWQFLIMLLSPATVIFLAIRGLFLQLNQSIYRIHIDDARLTQSMRWTKHVIAWNDIQLVYDVKASHPYTQTNDLASLTLISLSNMVISSFMYGYMSACYEIASEHDHIIVPFYSREFIGDVPPNLIGKNGKLLPIYAANFRHSQPHIDDEDTFMQHMDSILATIVARSHVKARALN